MKKIIIALDGFSACGKSTLAKGIAQQLHYSYVDSGAMYRAVTWYFIQHQIALNDDVSIQHALSEIHIEFHRNSETKLNETWLNGRNIEKEIRTMEVSGMVSEVAALKLVRQSMVALQRKAGAKKGIVMDGRDIGSNVFPHAELKIFLTAQPEIRAQRRFAELQEKGTPESIEAVTENLAHRDHIDSTREENPLIRCSDARVLDNSNLTKEEQLAVVISWAKELQMTPV
jgi:cytidylate kinase